MKDKIKTEDLIKKIRQHTQIDDNMTRLDIQINKFNEIMNVYQSAWYICFEGTKDTSGPEYGKVHNHKRKFKDSSEFMEIVITDLQYNN